MEHILDNVRRKTTVFLPQALYMMKEFLFLRLAKIELSSKSAELRYKRAEEQVLTEPNT